MSTDARGLSSSASRAPEARWALSRWRSARAAARLSSRRFKPEGERKRARQCGSRSQRRCWPRSQRRQTVGRLSMSNGLPRRTFVPRRFARSRQYFLCRDLARLRLCLRRWPLFLRTWAARAHRVSRKVETKNRPAAPHVRYGGGLGPKITTWACLLRRPETCALPMKVMCDASNGAPAAARRVGPLVCAGQLGASYCDASLDQISSDQIEDYLI